MFKKLLFISIVIASTAWAQKQSAEGLFDRTVRELKQSGYTLINSQKSDGENIYLGNNFGFLENKDYLILMVGENLKPGEAEFYHTKNGVLSPLESDKHGVGIVTELRLVDPIGYHEFEINPKETSGTIHILLFEKK